ncbi:MaoC/PaaZ C-terminal domain-containing protein [Gordonia rubripertincta]|uniref:MaoC/PaaZ C-terminal domain-containing protein n=1 Tax=Gordonia rubripertincta TaxID=36822 RepID=UPI000B8D5577|nr:MaoC/PaaZ C-terminal domain-containing protein [Gordonia rubripertincta]ASR05181.1 bifunctional enoyl-CoA hydratase/phosphate acetyltransferase [Gordonia rubripertincta]
MGKTITLPGAPGTGELYGKAVTGMLPGIGKPARVPADAPLPDTHYRLDDVRVDPAALQAYCHATGQRFGATLPVTYPFVLQFPVVMKLLTSDEFPFGAIGSVHMTNTIERKRPIEVGEPLSIETHAENLREHRKGILVDVISEISVGTELVTRQTATFLKQQRTSLSDEPRGPEPKSKTPPPPDSVLSVDLGRIREYAAASGDRNPIHMANLTAKAFGFPKAIAHGMWSAAAAIANVEAQLSGAVTYDVKFGKPILLPAKVNLYTRRIDGEGNFDIAIRDRRKGFPHLTATTRKG